uniref:Uncharacterized protein n=1 Tax=Arundo donax TaxID=35708 RepID=A0A0A9EBU6_ARUDO
MKGNRCLQSLENTSKASFLLCIYRSPAQSTDASVRIRLPRERFGSVLEVTRTWRHKKPGSDSFDIGTEAGAPTAAGSGGGIWSMH